MSDAPKLKPCPFCGWTEIRTDQYEADERDGYRVDVSVICNDCGGKIEASSEQDQNGWAIEDAKSVGIRAITAWNTRGGKDDR